jgi:hypothetical protein
MVRVIRGSVALVLALAIMAAASSARADDDDQPNPRKTQLIAFTVAGVALLGAGAVTSLAAKQDSDQVTRFCGNGSIDVDGTIRGCLWNSHQVQILETEGKDLDRAALVLYGVGGAVLITGVIVYLLSDDPDETPSPVSFAPTKGGAMLTGAWTF